MPRPRPHAVYATVGKFIDVKPASSNITGQRDRLGRICSRRAGVQLLVEMDDSRRKKA
jgi:hypothetical protein